MVSVASSNRRRLEISPFPRRRALTHRAAGGVWIFDPEGSHLGTVQLDEVPAQTSPFGNADGKTLYMTARTGVYRIRFEHSRLGALVP